MTTYEIPLDWVPDETYINARVGTHYIAWQIGRNEKVKTGLWLIEPVIDAPVDLDTLIPVLTVPFELSSDVGSTGHARTVQVNKTISEVETDFLAEVARVEAAIIAGTR